MGSLLASLRKEAEKKLKKELLDAYRYKSDGNTSMPDGTPVDRRIVEIEKELKIRRENT